MDSFALRPLPRTYGMFKRLLLDRVFSYRALGLARLLSLVTISLPREDLLKSAGFRLLTTASKSCWACFELSKEILSIEVRLPGTFTRAQQWMWT